MWPAEIYKMGLLRSAWGRRSQCQINMDDYRLKGNLWGRCPVVVCLGDPLQMRTVRATSLFDAKQMLPQRCAKGDAHSVETHWGTHAFNLYDYAFELTETERLAPGDPIVPFLQSLRDADPTTGKQ